jgi:hypothetical protein
VVNKPEAQEEWAYQGEYRLWSKRCASFNLPLWGEKLDEVARGCRKSGKNKLGNEETID